VRDFLFIERHIASPVEAVVVGYTVDNRNQV